MLIHFVKVSPFFMLERFLVKLACSVSEEKECNCCEMLHNPHKCGILTGLYTNANRWIITVGKKEAGSQ